MHLITLKSKMIDSGVHVWHLYINFAWCLEFPLLFGLLVGTTEVGQAVVFQVDRAFVSKITYLKLTLIVVITNMSLAAQLFFQINWPYFVLIQIHPSLLLCPLS